MDENKEFIPSLTLDPNAASAASASRSAHNKPPYPCETFGDQTAVPFADSLQQNAAKNNGNL